MKKTTSLILLFLITLAINSFTIFANDGPTPVEPDGPTPVNNGGPTPNQISENNGDDTAPTTCTELFNDTFADLSNWNTSNGWIRSTNPNDLTPAATLPNAADGYVYESNSLNAGPYYDAFLTLSAPVDITGYTTVILEFQSAYSSLDIFSTRTVEISEDGTSWDEVFNDNATGNNIGAEAIDLTATIAGYTSNNLYIRFRHYYNYSPSSNSDYWAIDDVVISGGPTCSVV